MKLSIITTITDPDKRQDPYLEALQCYYELADEVVIVNGGSSQIYKKIQEGLGIGQIQMEKFKIVELAWGEEWSWEELPKHLNAGLEAATGDWVIKMDIDQIIHESDFEETRKRLESCPLMVATFQKMSYYPVKRYVHKGQMLVAINKKEAGDSLKFGEEEGKYTDLCLPVLVDHINEKGVPVGKIPRGFGRTGVPIWNFDYTFKTPDVAMKEFFRFSKAHRRYFGTSSWGNSKEEAFKVLCNMIKTRIEKHSFPITDDSSIPKYVRKRLMNMRPDELGHSGWGII